MLHDMHLKEAESESRDKGWWWWIILSMLDVELLKMELLGIPVKNYLE